MDAVINYRSFIRGLRPPTTLLEQELLKSYATDINIDIWQQQQKLRIETDPPMRCYLRYSISMLLLMRRHIRAQLLLDDMTQSWMTEGIAETDDAALLTDDAALLTDDDSFSW